MKTSWLPRTIAHHPYIVILVTLIFSLICLIIPLITEKFPDFSDPQMVRKSMNLLVGVKRKFYIIDI